jgi:hypothetical protein
MELTGKQWLQIIGGSIAGLITSAALLNPLFGQDLALKIVAGLGIINIVINSIGAAISGQASLIKDVAAMPGVERVSVNANASATLAQAATDPTLKNVGATTPEVRQSLLAKAGS